MDPLTLALFLIPIGVLILLFSKDPVSILYYLLIFSIPFYKYRIISQQYPFLKVDYILGFVLIAIILSRLITNKTYSLNLKADIWPWLGVFFLINAISMLISPFRAEAIHGFIFRIIIPYAYIAIHLMCIDEKGFKSTLPFIIVLAVSICAAISFFAYVFHIKQFLKSSLTYGANNMAVMCIFVFPICIYFILHSDKFIVKFAYFIMLALCIAGLVTSFSRGGFINFIFVSLLTFFQNRKKITPRNFGIFVATMGILLMIMISLLPKEYIARIATLKKGTQADISTQRRAAYQRAGLKSFMKHPLLGTGPFTFKQVWLHSEEIKRFPFTPRPAHNTYMDVLTGSGILGLTAFLIILGKCLKNYLYAQRLAEEAGNESLASLIASYKISFVAICAYLLIMSAFQHKFFLLGIALSEISKRITEKEITYAKEAINNIKPFSIYSYMQCRRS